MPRMLVCISPWLPVGGDDRWRRRWRNRGAPLFFGRMGRLHVRATVNALLVFAAIAAVVLWERPASAQKRETNPVRRKLDFSSRQSASSPKPPPAPPAKPAVAPEPQLVGPPFGFDFDVHTGYGGGAHSSGWTLGISARLRWRIVSVGTSLRGTTQVIENTLAASALAGITLPFRSVRFDLLGEIGGSRYTGVGAGLLSHDPGANASIPFAGVRAALAYQVAGRPDRTRLWVGVMAIVTEDLERRVVTYRYTETNLISGDQSPEEVTRVLGQTSYSLLVNFGASFAL